ncbi:RNA 3'-terminal phosphate cyclase [Candidatus Woesearchaeota archaeon]|nr:RNA 3'-terminal phosphate cyclase [Candidatus Woesearchaeota archaeon]
MLELDGSEGGGQILRTAVALSGLTLEPFAIRKIRFGRPQPGLKAQHLLAMKLAAEWCAAELDGDSIGSGSLTFRPRTLEPKSCTVEVGTAGSISLVLQALLPLAAFGERKVAIRVKGGTDVEWSPPLDYLAHVLLPHLRPFASVECKLLKRGYYPKGGGIAEFIIEPRLSRASYRDLPAFLAAVKERIAPLDLVERGPAQYIQGVSHASLGLQQARVAERQADAARFYLKDLGVPVRISAEYHDTMSAGSGVTLWARCGDEGEHVLGASSLGGKGIPAEEVGKRAAGALRDEVSAGCCVDAHLADQLVPFLALSGGQLSAREFTDHCLANCATVERFLPVEFSRRETLMSVSRDGQASGLSRA